jgi:aminopeptidase N
MEHRWTEAHGGETTSRWLRDTYQTTTSPSFWSLVVADPGPVDLFDWPVYERGAMTLAALRNRIGSRRFSHLLRRWVALHRYGHGTTGAFETLAAQVSGQDLASFFDAWLHEPVQPADTAANGLTRG